MGGTRCRRLARLVLLVSALAVVSSGCSLLPPDRYPYLDVTHPRDAAAVIDPRCPRDGVGLGAGGMQSGAGPAPGTVPDGFLPARARLCRLHDDVAQAHGALRYTVDEQTSPVDSRLLGALTLPDQELDPRDHTACDASYTPPVFLVLLDAHERGIRALLPADPCGSPRSEVRAALDSLQPTTSTTYTFDQPGP